MARYVKPATSAVWEVEHEEQDAHETVIRVTRLAHDSQDTMTGDSSITIRVTAEAHDGSIKTVEVLCG